MEMGWGRGTDQERLFCRREERGGGWVDWRRSRREEEEARGARMECASTLKSLSAFYRSITGLTRARCDTPSGFQGGGKKGLLVH